MNLVSVIYVSYAVNPMSDQELLQILDQSRKNNSAKNITGMLLYRDHFFIQAIEGERADVKALYEKITKDPRHKNIRLIDRKVIQEREFTDWSMGFKNLDQVDPNEHPGFVDFLSKPADEDLFENNPSLAQRLLNAFRP